MPQPVRILLVEDDADLRTLVVTDLRARGHEVQGCAAAEEAIAALESSIPDVLLADVRLPGMDGVRLCEQVLREHPDVPVILMTGNASVDSVIGALRAGATDYLTKPVDPQALHHRIERVVERQRLREEVGRLRTALAGTRRFEGLIGSSPAMQRVYALLDRVSRSDATVLVTGESGSGKEVAARALHERSARAEQPFVAINCAAVPEQLLESELFGHAEGAFTDARTTREGLFARASGGTLLLDEIGELPLHLQPKLLRALEERRIRPVGSDEETPVDVRLVAATNRDLEAAVEDGRFREDLFFRVHVVRLDMPPLRGRGGDVLVLAQHFLDQLAARFDKPVSALSPECAERLLAYNWPGNVRELRNCMEHAVALADGEILAVGDLPERVRKHAAVQIVSGESDPEGLAPLEEVERRYIVHVMQAVDGNKTIAARILGLDRKTLRRRLQRYGGA